MGYDLRSGISFCEVSARLIFLDISEDRYFALEPEAEQALRRLIEARSDPADGRIEGLVERNILIRGPGDHVPRPCVAPPSPETSLLDEALPDAAMIAALRAAAGLMRTRIWLRMRGLSRLLAGLAARKSRCTSQQVQTDVLSAAAAFERASRLTRTHDQCLVRSAAMASRLFGSCADVQFVIAVRARPFAAHAWLQSGTRLLNDRVDVVRAYTPILVI